MNSAPEIYIILPTNQALPVRKAYVRLDVLLSLFHRHVGGPEAGHAGAAGALVNPLIVSDLADWAAEINSEHLAAIDCAETAIEHARRAGALLRKAKETLSHGEWLPWIGSNIRLGERQIQNYMRLARANTQRVADLSQRRALAELAAPKPKTLPDLRDIGASTRLDASPVPIETGLVTLGSVGSTTALVLIESREHPGYWHEIDLLSGTVSGRPMRAVGLQHFLARNPALAALEWTTAPDRGEFLELVS